LRNSFNRAWKNLFCAALTVILGSGCASLPKPENHATKNEWMKAVAKYRKEFSENPADYEVKMKLDEAELNAAEAFYEDGVSMEEQGLLDDAIYQFKAGVSAMPNNEKVSNALRRALAEKEANTLYQQAVGLENAGKEDDARNLLNQALSANPDHEGARALLKKMDTETEAKSGGLFLSSKEPVALHFNRTDLKAAFDFIGKSFGINVIFDDSLKSQEITLSAENVTFEQALELILHTTQTFYKQIGPNTILVAEDTKAKRSQYDDLIIKTIQLKSVKASDMANTLKSVIDLKHVVVNDQLNTLLIRDTRDTLDLAQEIIDVNDRAPAEVLLDVEILEVDRNKAETLGLDYGQALPVSFTQTTISGAGSIGSLLGQGGFTIPTVTLNYLMQDVDAKTLAHPQVRTLDRQQAKIHIGNRVPLPSAVIQQTTGQVQVTYNYTDIGVLLDVTPQVNLDRTVQVKLSLEVSSLGPNLGDAANPAYEIGTRDADTTMVLHDGESAILGGLIQDNDTKTHNKLPILGDIPFLGDFFTGNVNDSDARTDILLTITPRIVRDWNFPHKEYQEVYSGTGDNVSSKPLFTLFKPRAKGAAAAKIAVGEPVPPTAQATPSGTPTLPFQGMALNGPAANGGVAFSFGETQYEVTLGQPVELKLYGENLGKLKNVPLAVAFNAGFLKFVSADPGSAQVLKVDADSDEKHGLVKMNLSLKSDPAATGPVELVDLKLNGYAPGLSYLIFLNPTFKDEDGNEIHAQARASRISIK
jgi:general secretion pathway protein D